MGYFVATTEAAGSVFLLKQLRKRLGDIADVERSLQRLTVGVGTPKDLKNIAATVQDALALGQLLQSSASAHAAKLPPLPTLVDQSIRVCLAHASSSSSDARDDGSNSSSSDLLDAATTIQNALKDDFAALNSKNGFVRDGFSPDLDRWRRLLAWNSSDSDSDRDGEAAVVVEAPDKGSSEDSMTKEVDATRLSRKQLQQKYRRVLRSTKARVGFQAGRGYFLEIPTDENARLLQDAMAAHAAVGNNGNNGNNGDKTELAAHHRVLLQDLVQIQSTLRVVRYRTPELQEINLTLHEAAREVLIIMFLPFAAF